MHPDTVTLDNLEPYQYSSETLPNATQNTLDGKRVLKEIFILLFPKVDAVFKPHCYMPMASQNAFADMACACFLENPLTVMSYGNLEI